eukprot:CAMPEP_0172184576 /NCGR_PEP_ID=MMETSP1050-20130122/19659_1 /TAXON_ID=233186 /ORGANISM="Cryptomonas curvata, Strain CCAP979/52" /LENGTH=200 /DNA_ID=CAMNT_0012858403 /DNA_START=102 /DNA_END=700 /DNA_ORIENTATION=+
MLTENGPALLVQDDALEKVQKDVRASLIRATQKEMEVRNMMDAVSNSAPVHDPAKVKRAVQKRSHTIPHVTRTDSDDSEILQEAREAGARSLYERNPLHFPSTSLRTRGHVSARGRLQHHITGISVLAAAAGAGNTSSKTAPKSDGIANPRGYLKNDDRYVPSGAVLDRDAFIDKYLNPPQADNATNTTEPSAAAAAPAP